MEPLIESSYDMMVVMVILTGVIGLDDGWSQGAEEN